MSSPPRNSRAGRTGFLLLLLLSAVALPAAVAPRSAGSAPAALRHLSPDQRARLNQIYHHYHAQKQALVMRTRSLRRQVIAQIERDHPDKAAIKRQLDQIFQLESRHQQLVMDEYFEVMDVLQPAQKRAYRDELVRHLAESR